uniref:Mediator of RNA polymerase II transcription subunit 7 n=1 Tax=Strongyloides venezuelensis TaxID=75913 RepID=A0A0K0FHD9_STRVS
MEDSSDGPRSTGSFATSGTGGGQTDESQRLKEFLCLYSRLKVVNTRLHHAAENIPRFKRTLMYITKLLDDVTKVKDEEKLTLLDAN